MGRIPGGASTRSKQHHVFGGDPYPSHIWGASGAQVWVDGVEYTDWICALGAVGLGHRDGNVGFGALSLPYKREELTAETLLEALPKPPGWEQVRWVTTGSECTAAAMQVARMATHRKKIVSVGYHGWHEAHLASENLVALPISSPRAVREIDGDTAACIIEPMRDFPGQDWYFSDVYDACQATGALFILDEIVTGFRYALGGATELYGLKPDLACYGKAMSNGWPIAALVGPSKYMKHAVEVSGTYNGWPPALDRVWGNVLEYQDKDVVGHMYRMGERLLAGTKGVLTGWPCHPVFAASVDRVAHVQKAARGGHLLHPAGFNIMLAHTPEDVDRLIAALMQP